jgi:hypothetical protein
MSLPFRQQRRLRGTRHALVISAPQLTSMLVIFARLYDGDTMPAHERVRHRLPGPVRALARAAWAFLRWCGRALAACSRLLRPIGQLLRRCGRPLRPPGQVLRRAAVRCLTRWSFLPAGFRLTLGAWLVASHSAASAPPAAHRRNR